jgi:[acyl-carrier-protein] S-malonyltransferase
MTIWSLLHSYDGGESLHVPERIVVSPATGVFVPAPAESPREWIEVGTLLGTVGDAEVRSVFSGHFMGALAHDGERLTKGQPVAWLRIPL